MKQIYILAAVAIGVITYLSIYLTSGYSTHTIEALSRLAEKGATTEQELKNV